MVVPYQNRFYLFQQRCHLVEDRCSDSFVTVHIVRPTNNFMLLVRYDKWILVTLSHGFKFVSVWTFYSWGVPLHDAVWYGSTSLFRCAVLLCLLHCSNIWDSAENMGERLLSKTEQRIFNVATRGRAHHSLTSLKCLLQKLSIKIKVDDKKNSHLSHHAINSFHRNYLFCRK